MNREKVSIYPRSFQDALDYEQTDQWNKSHEENIACKNFIEQTIRDNFDGMHLSADCAMKVVDEFGYKRTAFVIANSVQMKSSDGRFSRENKEFANGYSFADRKEHRALFAVDSHPAVFDGFIIQYHKLYSELGLLTSKHCLSQPEHQNYEGQVIVVNPSYFAEDYLKAENQLWLATGGFGCDPSKMGNAIYATCIADGEKARWERYQVLGVIDEQHLPQWANEKLTEMGIETLESKEKRLLEAIKNTFTEQEDEDFIAITEERYGIDTVAEEINFALAIKGGQFEFYYGVDDRDEVGRKYVDSEHSTLDGIILDNLDFDGVGETLENNGGAFYNSTFIVNYDDHPEIIYQAEEIERFLEEYAPSQGMTQTQTM